MQMEQELTRQSNGVDRARPRGLRNNGAERAAKGLGWFSLGLGAAQIFSPSQVARLIGAPDNAQTRSTLLAIGLREVASGLGILSQRQPAGWVWGRVVGDLIDIALLTRNFNAKRAVKSRTTYATAAVVGVTLLDALSAARLTQKRRVTRALNEPGFHVSKSVTVNRSREDVYRFWRNLENLPQFMAHLSSVRVHNGTSVWRAKAPIGLTVEWEAEITVDRPDEMIAWRSLPNSTVPNFGMVRFVEAPGNRGTEVKVELSYRPPAGSLGVSIAKLFGEEPGQQIQGDLRRLKQVLETGEVVHSDASIHKGMHAARPPKQSELKKRGLR
jgi:uncharacterized membrane protein